MSELVEDGSMAGSLKMQSSTGDGNKDVLLRKLQKSIHFVKTVTSSSIRGGNYMTLPTWFVNEHGDKFQQTIFLRSGLSTELWRVQLYIHTGSSSRSPEVKLCTGWRDFAVFHELILGDDLLFSLRAISEFDVYIFRETSNPVKASSIRALRKRSQDFEVSQEEVLQKAGECSVGHLKPERSERPVDGSSGLFTTKKKVEVEGPIFAFQGRSAAGRWRGTSTSDVHYLVSRNLRDPPFSRSDSHQDQQHPIRELEQVKRPCTGSAQRIGARKSKANEFKDKAAEGTKTFPPRFLRRLNASNFSSGRGAATARLVAPSLATGSFHIDGEGTNA
ncbi:hypothetical protein M758_6G003500 [Ceratodon purpureus]|nr:hypothetical protein M758_6G003500 [Ceratodon purpureus]